MMNLLYGTLIKLYLSLLLIDIIVFGLKRRIRLQNKDIKQRFEDINKSGNFVCTDLELCEFIRNGCVVQIGNKFIDRSGKLINIDVIEDNNYRLTINLSSLIAQANELCEKHKCNKIYCMTAKLFDRYYKLGFIVQKGDVYYYRYYENELWLINIV